jgi:hypothetical protein
MSKDPRHPDDGNPEDNKKTRLIMRPDVAEGGTNPSNDAPRGGAIIGTTRLVGNIAQAAPRFPAPGAPNARAQPLAKTQYVREGTIDIEPVAGWIVVVNKARYKSRELNDGDTVELGEVRLRFRAETEFQA